LLIPSALGFFSCFLDRFSKRILNFLEKYIFGEIVYRRVEFSKSVHIYGGHIPAINDDRNDVLQRAILRYLSSFDMKRTSSKVSLTPLQKLKKDEDNAPASTLASTLRSFSLILVRQIFIYH